jgi:acyl carrier protein
MIETKLKDIISTQLGILPGDIAIGARLVDDLNADSLDLVELVMRIEKEFKICIEESEYRQADTIEKISELVGAKLSNKK